MHQKLFTPNFTFLILGQVFSLIGNYTLKFALSMYVLEQTGSAGVFAGLLSAAMLPTILLSPFGGILADRANRRSLMVALDALSGAAVLLSFLLFRTEGAILRIGVLLVFLSVLGAFESPTVQACVPQMQSGDNILRGNAVVNQVAAAASLVTPFTGSLFYAAFGIRVVLLATAACFFLTALLECFIRLEYHRPAGQKSACQIIRDDFADSFRFLTREQPFVLRLLLLAALVNFFMIGILTVGFPFLVRTVLGLTAGHYGAAESAMGVAAILGSLLVGALAGRLPTSRLHWFIIALGACLFPAGGVFLLPLDAFAKYLALVLASCAGQLIGCVFSIFALSFIQARTPQTMLGKVMAYTSTLSMCAQPLGQIVYGLLFDAFAGNVPFILLGTGCVLCLIGLLSARLFATA